MPTDLAQSADLVSVILPARNQGRYVADAIASVRAQSWARWECIAIDDGSTDDTAEALAAIAREEPRVKFLTQSHRGVSAARNVGLIEAKGQFVQFLDADDVLNPEKLKAHAHALRTDPDIDIVYGPTTYFTGDLPRAGAWSPTSTTAGTPVSVAPILHHLLEANPMTIEAPLIRRTLLDRIGGFTETLALMEDWDLWLRAALQGARFQFMSASEPVALIRLHEASSSYDKVPMLQSEIAIRLRLTEVLIDPSLRALNRRGIELARARLGELALSRGELVTGLRYIVPSAVSQRRIGVLRVGLKPLLKRIPGVISLVRGFRRLRPRRTAPD